MFGISLFRPSRQSNISTSSEERFKYPLREQDQSNALPQGQQRQSNPHPMPCLPPSPAGHDIDRCISKANGWIVVTCEPELTFRRGEVNGGGRIFFF